MYNIKMPHYILHTKKKVRAINKALAKKKEKKKEEDPVGPQKTLETCFKRVGKNYKIHPLIFT